MHVLEDLSYELEDMLEPIVKKGDISPTELDNVKDAVKAMYYIETIKAMKEYGNSNDYSYRGSSYRYDGMRSYDDGYSERRGRDSRGRYTSRDYSRDDMLTKLEKMMNNASSESERRAIQDCISKLDR